MRDDGIMQATRTTIAIDDDVLIYARQLSADTGKPLGRVLSELARTAMAGPSEAGTRNGVQLLPIRDGARNATLEDVNRLRDELT